MTLNKHFGEELLHKIKDERLQPKPRWQFLLKNYTVWGLGILAMFLGAVSMSLIFYMSNYSESDLYERAGGLFWEKIFLVVPFFWVICLVFFVFVVLYNIKHTKKGYRYPLPFILAFIISTSIILGGIFYVIGFGEKIDDELGQHAPFYDQVMNPHIDFWSQPERGRLMGMIISQSGDKEYILVDRENREWLVFAGSTSQPIDNKIQIGRPVRLLGRVRSDNKFNIIEILSIAPGKGFFEKFGPSSPKKMAPPSSALMMEKKQFNQVQNNFCLFLEKYPEIKLIFASSLLENKEVIKKIEADDPQFFRYLEFLNSGTSTTINWQQ
ncbi:MAG TPA: hypothetical protein PLH29_04440 [bacterium]|nr:hypothetical protein [bacterium]